MTVANDTPVREIWNRRVTQDHVLRLFGEWRTPWLDLPALIRRTPEIYEFPLADRDPVQAWTFGRVTLVGDAAHPMQPRAPRRGGGCRRRGRCQLTARHRSRDGPRPC